MEQMGNIATVAHCGNHANRFYTYVTNQSQKKVYFNNLTVHHLEQLLIGAQRKFRAANPALPFSGERGNIRQINDYYPYGLTWSKPEGANAQMYQSKQWQQDEWSTSGLDMYDFHARMYDPVLGRWHAPDPMNQYDSPYTAMGNNPVTTIDPDGMLGIPWGGILGSLGSISWITNCISWSVTPPTTFDMGGSISYSNSPQSHSLFGKAGPWMQLAGSLLAFGQGSKILNEGQRESGMNAIASLEAANWPIINGPPTMLVQNTYNRTNVVGPGGSVPGGQIIFDNSTNNPGRLANVQVNHASQVNRVDRSNFRTRTSVPIGGLMPLSKRDIQTNNDFINNVNLKAQITVSTTNAQIGDKYRVRYQQPNTKWRTRTIIVDANHLDGTGNFISEPMEIGQGTGVEAHNLPNSFTVTNITNMQPGSNFTVTLTYSQFISPNQAAIPRQGIMRFVRRIFGKKL